MQSHSPWGHWLSVLLMVHLLLPELYVAGRVGTDGPEGQPAHMPSQKPHIGRAFPPDAGGPAMQD